MSYGGRIALPGDEPEGPYQETPGPSTMVRNRDWRDPEYSRYIPLEGSEPYVPENGRFLGFTRRIGGNEFSRFVPIDESPPEFPESYNLGGFRRGRGVWR